MTVWIMLLIVHLKTFTRTLNDGVDNVTYRAFEDLYMYT